MYLYMDESGDLGFDFENKQSSDYFVMGLLVCENENSVLTIKRSVARTLKNKLRNKKDEKNNIELKGLVPLSVKLYFFENANKSDSWKIYVAILDKKAALKTLNVNVDKHEVYNVLAINLLKKVNFSGVKMVNLFIGRSKNRRRIAEFNMILQESLNFLFSLDTRAYIWHVLSDEN